jgi:hypothetical protein
MRKLIRLRGPETEPPETAPHPGPAGSRVWAGRPHLDIGLKFHTRGRH